MNLHEKILIIYPQLTDKDFFLSSGTILLQNDGIGDYIKEWNNALLRPTDEQLNGF
jgi:hypothetical protein